MDKINAIKKNKYSTAGVFVARTPRFDEGLRSNRSDDEDHVDVHLPKFPQ
jgi:hypothetical protein